MNARGVRLLKHTRLWCLLAASAAFLGPACRCTDMPDSHEERVRAALDANALGVSPEASAEQRLAALRSRVLKRPAPILFHSVGNPEAVTQANTVLTDGWSVRAHQAIALGPSVEWGTVQDKDVNWHYLLNALDPIKDVLVAYQQTQERRYIEPARAMLLDWINFNLVQNRENARKWHDMATGYRAERLAFILDDALRSTETPDSDLGLLLYAALKHAEFLADPDNFPKGNHGLFMVLGLAALCHNLPELAQCKERSQYARTALSSLLALQFHQDEGIHLEGAPEYHLFMVRKLSALKSIGLFDDDTELAELVTRVRQEAVRMFHPNGDAVLVGDSSDKAPQDYFDDSPQLHYAFTDGAQGHSPGPASIVFPKTGYAIFRSPWTQHPFREHSFLFFSGARYPSPHSHRDDFTFEWSERGVPLIVDSGKYVYDKGPWREFFTSTRAGNTLEIDGKEHARPNEHSMLKGWGTAPPLQFVEAAVSRDKEVEHRRLMVLSDNCWLAVVDMLESSREHTYRQWFGFHEGATVTQSGDSGLTIDVPGDQFTLRANSVGAQGVELHQGEETPRIAGWLSRTYSVKTPRTSAAFHKRAQDTTLATVFVLNGESVPPTLSEADERLEMRWSTPASATCPNGFVYTGSGKHGRIQAVFATEAQTPITQPDVQP